MRKAMSARFVGSAGRLHLATGRVPAEAGRTGFSSPPAPLPEGEGRNFVTAPFWPVLTRFVAGLGAAMVLKWRCADSFSVVVVTWVGLLVQRDRGSCLRRNEGFSLTPRPFPLGEGGLVSCRGSCLRRNDGFSLTPRPFPLGEGGLVSCRGSCLRRNDGFSLNEVPGFSLERRVASGWGGSWRSPPARSHWWQISSAWRRRR